MRILYLLAASDLWQRAKRRLPGLLAWAAFTGLMLAPFACAYFAGRASCP